MKTLLIILAVVLSFGLADAEPDDWPLDDSVYGILSGISLTNYFDNSVTSEEYAKGVNDALETISLLNLELHLSGERKTFGEMSDIVRNRLGVLKNTPN